MSEAGDAVLQSVAQAALEATGSSSGRIVAREDDALRVVAAVGDDAAGALGSDVAPESETVGYVLASGQPVSLAPSPDGPSRETTVLCVPCLAGQDVVGALELVDKVGGDAFPLHEQRLATLLGGVAGAAIASGAGPRQTVASPAELGTELTALSQTDPARYAVVAQVIGSLLAHG